MHVPAETAFADTPSVPAYGGEVPMQFGSSVAAGTSTPRGPAATIFASSCGVSQLGLGRSSVVGAESSVVAPATVPPRAATRNAAATTSATSDLCIRPPIAVGVIAENGWVFPGERKLTTHRGALYREFFNANVSLRRLGVPPAEADVFRVGEEVDDFRGRDPPLRLAPELRCQQVGVVVQERLANAV